MKKTRAIIAGLGAIAMSLSFAACGSGDEASAADGSDDDVTVGFVAVGPEGGYRTAQENNIKDAFKKAGITLKYAASTGTNSNDQKPQLDAFASFVNDEVDAILLDPTEASGWHDAMEKAKKADIPVILVDRKIEPDEKDLYAAHIGVDYVAQGKDAGEWAAKEFPDGAKAVVLEGPAGLSVVNDRNKGWAEGIKGSKITELEHQSANWDTEEGKTVTQGLLDKYKNDIQVIFAENDEMGLGAIQAIEAKGLTPGKDIKVIGADATKPALEAVAAGKMAFDVETTPNFGEQAVSLIKDVLAGKKVPQETNLDYLSFDQKSAKEALDAGTRTY